MTASFMAAMAQTELEVSTVNTQTPTALTAGVQISSYGHVVPCS